MFFRYQLLSYDGYGENATFTYLKPSLIVNKPFTGWLCSQCQDFHLGHGCFNSGVLLWRRSNGMKLILQRWWESRMDNGTSNIIRKDNGTFHYFHGWGIDSPANINSADKMSEQNRLMYIFHHCELFFIELPSQYTPKLTIYINDPNSYNNR